MQYTFVGVNLLHKHTFEGAYTNLILHDPPIRFYFHKNLNARHYSSNL